MALTDIVTFEGATAEFLPTRGNIGIITDIQSRTRNTFELPALGGSCSYPSVDDVRDGTVFGTIYTGNLVLPAEADVLTGTGYGSNGTEFTGIATA